MSSTFWYSMAPQAPSTGMSMISNERSSPYGGRPYGQPRNLVPEETLKVERIQIERKTFVLALKENPRGRFLRITEDVGGRRDTIIVPATGLDDFKKVVEDMLKLANEPPPQAAAANLTLARSVLAASSLT